MALTVDGRLRDRRASLYRLGVAVLLVRSARGTPEREETILVCTEEVVPIYAEI